MLSVYQSCPIYFGNKISLKQTQKSDANDLLKCYSDERAVPFFNSDNCHGDDFFYTSIERMEQAIDFWNYSYKEKYFVRWSVVINSTQEVVGTIEMFHRIAEDEFNHYGVLRIDLQSFYEKYDIINDILIIANQHFYDDFEVKYILTKAIPSANERIKALIKNEYSPINKKVNGYADYYFK